jgi:hypothetical protein
MFVLPMLACLRSVSRHHEPPPVVSHAALCVCNAPSATAAAAVYFAHRTLQVVSQLNTFLVAAFETTASAIACCIYFIAQHPEVQAALLQEVVGFGRSRQVTYSDLDQVRWTASQRVITLWLAIQNEKMLLLMICRTWNTSVLVIISLRRMPATLFQFHNWPAVCVCLYVQFPYADAILKETLRLIPPGAIAARFTEQGYQLTPEVGSSSKQLCSQQQVHGSCEHNPTLRAAYVRNTFPPKTRPPILEDTATVAAADLSVHVLLRLSAVVHVHVLLTLLCCRKVATVSLHV